MKIAVITDDGKNISQHFGRASYYLVATVENNQIIDRELRGKLGHAQFRDEGHEHHEDSSGRHGYGPAAENRHARMARAISDCQVLLCRGMDIGAYESMQARSISPVVTDIASIEEAVIAYLNGRIVNHVDYLH
jgi:predicted Fe-Mo cluster-binding NifX family protein